MIDFNINGHLKPLTHEDVWQTNYADYIPHEIEEFLQDSDLNVCNKCGIIARWFDEMFWKGEECERTNEVLGDWDAVCDECFIKLENDLFGNVE